MAIHLGHLRGGWPGLVLAGVCFIVPAMLLVGAMAWVYVRYGSLPQAAGVLYGIKPVVMAIVIQALWGLGRSALKNRTLAIIGALAAVAVASGAHELVVLLLAALAAIAVKTARLRFSSGRVAGMAIAAGVVAGGSSPAGPRWSISIPSSLPA